MAALIYQFVVVLRKGLLLLLKDKKKVIEKLQKQMMTVFWAPLIPRSNRVLLYVHGWGSR